MIKAFIFDMDGVICDSEWAHIQSSIDIMKQYGVNLTETDLQIYMGRTAQYMFKDLIKKHNLDADWEQVNTKKEEIFIPLLRKNVKPIPGVLDFIHWLHNQGYKLALASSSKRILINIILKKFKLKDIFRVAISGAEIQESKPHPEIFLKAAEGIQTDPEYCCVIEDASSGVEAAKRAGMKCIGFINPHAGNQKLSRADAVIDSFANMEDVVRALITPGKFARLSLE